MNKEEIKFSMDVYNSSDELNEDDSFLLSEARSVTQFAYAPYSNFQVGAVAKLINGEIVPALTRKMHHILQVFVQKEVCFLPQQRCIPALRLKQWL